MARRRTPDSLPMAPLKIQGGDRCAIDGGELRAGICQIGGGFPYWNLDDKGDLIRRPCQFSCPICRATLEWDGACQRCFGTSTRKGQWTFPGDRYDMWNDEGKEIGNGWHWVRVDGPRDAVSSEDNADCMQAIKRVLAAMPELGKKGKRWL